jgi:hypothetical protein
MISTGHFRQLRGTATQPEDGADKRRLGAEANPR